MKIKTYGTLIFVGLILVYATDRWLQRKGVILPFVNSYLNDLLSIPLVLSAMLFFIRKFIIRTTAYFFSIYHILLACLYFSLVFEGYLPAHSARFTRDYWDVVCYFIGGMGYYWFMRDQKYRLRIRL